MFLLHPFFHLFDHLGFPPHCSIICTIFTTIANHLVQDLGILEGPSLQMVWAPNLITAALTSQAPPEPNRLAITLRAPNRRLHHPRAISTRATLEAIVRWLERRTLPSLSLASLLYTTTHVPHYQIFKQQQLEQMLRHCMRPYTPRTCGNMLLSPARLIKVRGPYTHKHFLWDLQL